MPPPNRIVLIPATQLQTTLVGLNILIQQILDNLVEENLILVSTAQLQTILTHITTLFQELLENLVEQNADTDDDSPPAPRRITWRKHPKLPYPTPDIPY
jgi:hypothetical protein